MQPEVFHANNTVLMLEGGGMRASYTAGIVSLLMEQHITFDHVCGISAGSSHTVNYLSGDIWRTRASFVDLVKDPHFGGVRTFLEGKGMFSAHWIYEVSGLPGGVLPFDMDAFLANPTPCSIQAFDRDTGEDVVWRREDMQTLHDLMVRVRASSTLPIVMPPVTIDGHVYYDGGLGVGGGIPLQLAIDSGCERIFAVRTRRKGFRKPWPDIGRGARLTAERYRNHPKVREALLTRNQRYNEACDALEELEREGRAYIVYAEDMAVENSTTDLHALRASYFDGYAQAQREIASWRDWLAAGNTTAGGAESSCGE